MGQRAAGIVLVAFGILGHDGGGATHIDLWAGLVQCLEHQYVGGIIMNLVLIVAGVMLLVGSFRRTSSSN